MNKIYTKQPRIAWTITGSLVGTFMGLAVVRAFGLASRGIGFDVAGWALGGAFGAYVGYRFGDWLRNRSLRTSTRQPPG